MEDFWWWLVILCTLMAGLGAQQVWLAHLVMKTQGLLMEIDLRFSSWSERDDASDGAQAREDLLQESVKQTPSSRIGRHRNEGRGRDDRGIQLLVKKLGRNS